MASTAEPDTVASLPGWVKASWLVPLVLGIVMVGFGILLLFNLEASVNTLRWLVVLSLALAAVEALATASLRQRPWVGWLAGALYLVGAIVCIAWPGVTVLALVLTVGVSFLVGGIVQAAFAFQLRGEDQGWVWALVGGIVSVVAGLFFLFGNPVVSAAVLAVVLAIYVFMIGATLIALALVIRRVAKAVGTAVADGRPARPDGLTT